MTAIKYIKSFPEGRIVENSNCSAKQKNMVFESLEVVKGYIETAEKKWDRKIFKKWFGVSTSLSDKNVKTRFKRANKMLFQ